MERMNSWGSSGNRNSLTPLSRVSHQIDDDADRESVSKAGDIGDRALHSTRCTESGSLYFASDYTPEDGGVVSFPGDQKLQPCPAALNSISSIKASAQLVTPHSSNGKEHDKGLPKTLDYVSCMIHLAVFGILGVLTRYLLQKLFGPGEADVTSYRTILYLDLPSNMVDSFLMGWFGVAFKRDISRVSEHLAITLTTGEHIEL